jgi:hypothetical protein
LRRVGVVLGDVGLLGVAGGLLVARLSSKVGVTLLYSGTGYDGTGAFAELAF